MFRRLLPQTRSISISVPARECLWFYATDIPKLNPLDEKFRPNSAPKKFKAFSRDDSQRLEEQYKSILNANHNSTALLKVPVNEDFLFEVDLGKLELYPAYWNGPVYEVRRGVWFDSSDNPLAKELSDEIDAHYAAMAHKNNLHINQTSKQSNEIKDNVVQDIYKLKCQERGKYLLIVDESTCFILKDLSGGELKLGFLRSNIARKIPLDALKIIKAGSKRMPEDKPVDKKDTNTTDESVVSTAFFGKLGGLLNWESSGSLFSLFVPKINSGDSEELTSKPQESALSDYKKVEDISTKNYHREVNNLVLCVHGIGQNLGKKYEYINFSQTVNFLRSSMKSVYKSSEGLKEINKKNGYKDWEENCNVQVLPITWRHSIDFQTDHVNEDLKKSDLPLLTDITVDGVITLRKLLADVAFDILLYCDPYYKEMIMEKATSELNRIYCRFKEKNPKFDGQIHLMGHSLGSVILFDILSSSGDTNGLKFKVDNYFSVGSPIGLLKLIARTMIAPKDGKKIDYERINSPDCKQFYNIFHACDPVAYRIEPLVHRSLSQYHPVKIPSFSGSFTKKVLEIQKSFMGSLSDKDTDKIEDQNLRSNSDNPLHKKVNDLNQNLAPSEEIQRMLKGLNDTGRVDYIMSPNFLEVDIISAIRSHIAYFEDSDIAAFMLREILRKREDIQRAPFERKNSVD